MSYLEELLPEFRKGAKIRRKHWSPNKYIRMINFDYPVMCNNDEKYNFISGDFLGKDWELYQEPIDWDYIIRNKCLCWFWDVYEEDEVIGFVKNVFNRETNKFQKDGFVFYDNCRPVRRDEVTFYEDKKND